MKSQSLKLFAAAFVLGLVTIFASAVSAQTQTAMSFETSFDFQVGKEKMSAGKYQIKRIQYGRYLLKNTETKDSALVQADFQVNRKDKGNAEQIIFYRYGEIYFLRQIADRRDIANELVESSYEARVRQNSKENEEKIARKDKKPDQISVTLNR